MMKIRTDYLDFCARATKLLNSTGNRLVKLNILLTMLAEHYAVRNPILVVRDSVTNRFNIELAPEMTENETNNLSKSLSAYISRYSHMFAYELILSPEEVKNMPFALPGNIDNTFVLFISHPIYGQNKSSILGILAAFIQSEDRIEERLKLLSVIANMIGFYLDTQDFNEREIYEPQVDGMTQVLEGIIGAGAEMKRLGEMVKKVSSSRASVFIRGESGTGKELVARAIHKYSLRSCAPFIGVNCAALPETLLESELFGHEKGAFTDAISAKKGRFELANGGTLFLDEIGETSVNFQTKLLRVLQEGEFERLGSVKTIKVDVRVLCSTNADIEDSIRKGTFREDLYYRLNVIPMRVPPLRERREDIQLLAKHFLAKLNEEYGKTIQIRDKDARYLQNMEWPGNVRELENFMHRAFLMEQGGFISTKAAIHRESGTGGRIKTSLTETDFIENEEIRAINSALRASRGIQVEAAGRLGVSLRQLRYRIRKYNIKVRKIYPL